MKNEIFTISELNQFIKDVINSGFPQAMWICGEIQGYDRNKDKNHIFFELVEKDPASKDVCARVGVVIFGNRKFTIETILARSENSFALKDDIEVKFLCKIDFYAPHGAVRLVIESIDPIYTLGKIAQEKQKLIALLKEKGLLDKNKQLELPLVPLQIGLITSHDSAAYNDFCSELKRSGYSFVIYVRNALMQGKKTENDICQAIGDLCVIKSLDCIVITRGGGSIAELSAFDSQKIAEKIAACRLPVLSGIGHEINTTITDLAAHTFAKTPTAIAQFLIERVRSFVMTLDEHLASIVDLAQAKVDTQKQGLKDKVLGLQHHTIHYLKSHREKLLGFEHVLKYRPVVVAKDAGRHLRETEARLLKVVRLRLDNDHKVLLNFTKLIDMLHPANTMKRGFTIVRNKKGKVVKSIKELAVKDLLELQLVDGTAQSEVLNIRKE